MSYCYVPFENDGKEDDEEEDDDSFSNDANLSANLSENLSDSLSALASRSLLMARRCASREPFIFVISSFITSFNIDSKISLSYPSGTNEPRRSIGGELSC